jgi:glycosyltransferase involved in cell wall biosynthesis
MRPADVSVIIPSNRPSRYLAEAVASVRNQTVAVREIILVDDGSPAPGLGAVADELGLAYLRQEAAGVSTARNRGAASARSRWIAFLDDDDVWYPTKIEDQLEALAAAPGAIACHSDLTIIDEQGMPLEQIVSADGTRTELLGRGNGVSINTLLILREAYLTLGGCDTSLAHAEDLDLILRMLQVGDFAKVRKPLVGYRRHSGQVTSDGRRSLSAYLAVVRHVIARAQRTGDDESAALLREHLRRVLPGMADWGADDLITNLLRGRLGSAMASARWLLANTGAAGVPALGRRACRRLAQRVSRRSATRDGTRRPQ